MSMAGPHADPEAIRAEAASTKETADRLANGDYPEGADETRVLAGMVKQLAEQIERLAAMASSSSTSSGSPDAVSSPVRAGDPGE